MWPEQGGEGLVTGAGSGAVGLLVVREAEPGIPTRAILQWRWCKWRPGCSEHGFGCRLVAAERLCWPASLALGWVDRNESHPGPA